MLRKAADVAPISPRVFWIRPHLGLVAGLPAARPLLMSEPPSARFVPSQKHKSLLERLTAFIFREPENREELLEALHDAHERNLLDADAM
jgi:hypothetical protein